LFYVNAKLLSVDLRGEEKLKLFKHNFLKQTLRPMNWLWNGATNIMGNFTIQTLHFLPWR